MKILSFMKSSNTMKVKLKNGINNLNYEFPFTGNRVLTDDDKFTRHQKENIEFNVLTLWGYATAFGAKAEMFKWYDVNSGSGYANV